jgi:DNA-3-methyladenine glycosylase II
MFLIFRLHRPDVLPVDDLGIVNAVKRAYGLRARPTPDRLTRIGEAWRPYRSVACWYLWASLDPPPPKATARLAGARVNANTVISAKKEQRT